MVDHFTFPDTEAGLTLALLTTLSLRRHGFKTRLATRQLTRMTVVHTVVATPPPRPNRAARGVQPWTHPLETPMGCSTQRMTATNIGSVSCVWCIVEWRYAPPRSPSTLLCTE